MNSNIETLQNSITNFQVLFLKYKSGIGVISEREIEPLALFFEQNEWKTVAFCRLRSEKRTFMLSRFYSLEVTNDEFAPNLFSLEEYFRGAL
jgi:predicted DNA-binding transcriptional regulator YafY